MNPFQNTPLNSVGSLRTCLRPPIPEIFDAADLIRSAVEAHLQNHRVQAQTLLEQANSPAVRDWLNSVWGKGSPYVKARTVPDAPRILDKSKRLETRMPNAAEKAALHERDGFSCRFCGLPVIRREVRHYLHTLYPAALPWGRTNASQHSAFQALWAQYDHILPHSRGGTNALGNMVIACAACNFGRMDYTLAEVGIDDPRMRSPQFSTWSGLEHVLPMSRRVVSRRRC